jgi:hypothetical protein
MKHASGKQLLYCNGKKYIHKRYHKLELEQFGFWKISQDTELCSVSQTIDYLQAFNNKMHAGVISYDLAKASDSANHEIYLLQLSFHRI